MFEEVKKQIEIWQRNPDIYLGDGKGYRKMTIDDLALQICRLFPKSEDNPNGYEQKLDDRLLIKPCEDSLWMDCLLELYERSRKEGKETVIFADVDKLVIEKSKIASLKKREGIDNG